MYDSIIIGGGPAGMVAALNLLRENRKVLIIEKEAFGGQIATSPRVENYPSIKSISGLELSSNIFDQISDMGVEFELETVTSVEKVDNHFVVKTDYSTYESLTVIIATGVSHKHIGVEGELDLVGKGVSYCATCDGPFYKDEEVSLIGDANTAVQYAILLANYCKKVKICTLFDKFFADKVIVDRMLSLPNIEIRHNLSLKKFVLNENGAFKGLLFEDTKTKEEVEVDSKGTFIAIGQEPHNEFLGDLVDFKKGFILTNELKETKTPGLFAAGDCTDKLYRQVITATSDGAIAAIRANIYLGNL